MAIVLGILTVIFMVLLIPVRVLASAQSGGEASAVLRYLFFSWRLFPSSEKGEEEGEHKEEKKKKRRGDRPKRGPDLLVTELLTDFERLARPVKRLLRRTAVARFSLRLVVVGEDAAETALRFGKANAVIFGAVAVLNRIFTLRVKQIELIPGFTAEREEYFFSGELRVVPLTVLVAAAQMGFWVLVVLIRSARAQNKQKKIDRRDSRSGVRKEDSHGNEASYQ